MTHTRYAIFYFSRYKQTGRQVQVFDVRFIIHVIFFGLALLTTSACYAEDRQLQDQNADFTFPLVKTLPLGLPIGAKPAKADLAKIKFGQFLFFSPLMSAKHSTSCATCHVPSQAMSGITPVAIGNDNQIGRRHAPPIFNLYYSNKFMWDGRISNLRDQIHIPMESSTEMKIVWPDALSALGKLSETGAFLNAERRGHLNKKLVLSSLASYIGSLVSGNSLFDRYFYGDEKDALDQEAQDGLKIFMRKGQCSTCHLLTGYSAPLTDNGFHSIGVGFADGTYKDKGRFDITGSGNDLGSFKTPTLRNVAQRKFYMHDGSMASLREVIDYYNRGGNRDAPNLDTRLHPLFLSEDEIRKLIAFLNTLNAPIEIYQLPIIYH